MKYYFHYTRWNSKEKHGKYPVTGLKNVKKSKGGSNEMNAGRAAQEKKQLPNKRRA